jgi:hypothetical protein
MREMFIIVSVFLSVVIGGVITWSIGRDQGAYERQQLIVQECLENGVYLDRRILLECRVNEPVRKSV